MRNLKSTEHRKVFAKDSDTAPQYGRRVTPHEWDWKQRSERDGLSVNQSECVCSPQCSVILQDPSRRHVAEFELRKFAEAIGMNLVAIYSPTENPCHFCITVTDGKLLDLHIRVKMKLKTMFAYEVPPAPPQDPAKREELEHKRLQHDAIFFVHRDAYVAETEHAP